MSEDTSLDFIPDDLSEDAKSKLRELTVESVPEPASLDVNEYLIRHWCETLEDGNPLYLDDAYAKSKGYPGVLAPPGSFMTAFVMPFRWPWPPGGREPAPHIHYDIKDALGLPVGIIGSIDVEMGVPLHVGDRISVSQRLVDISPWKKTRLGEGHFWTMDRLYRNQNGELVARERMSAFGYGRDSESQQAPSGWRR
jgi:acyl dehydratase